LIALRHRTGVSWRTPLRTGGAKFFGELPGIALGKPFLKVFSELPGGHMLDNQQTDRSWREIAAEMTHEQDTDKLLQLAKELNDTMQNEEREKVRKRLGLDNTPAA
jgi:hypothetical protein